VAPAVGHVAGTDRLAPRQLTSGSGLLDDPACVLAD